MTARVLALGLATFVLLTACNSGLGDRSLETYVCPNGPDLAIAYDGDTALITLPDGRKEVLQRTEPGKEIYAKPGMVWQITAFRTGRLTDGSASYHCDQSSV